MTIWPTINCTIRLSRLVGPYPRIVRPPFPSPHPTPLPYRRGPASPHGMEADWLDHSNRLTHHPTLQLPRPSPPLGSSWPVAKHCGRQYARLAINDSCSAPFLRFHGHDGRLVEVKPARSSPPPPPPFTPFPPLGAFPAAGVMLPLFPGPSSLTPLFSLANTPSLYLSPDA